MLYSNKQNKRFIFFCTILLCIYFMIYADLLVLGPVLMYNRFALYLLELSIMTCIFYQ